VIECKNAKVLSANLCIARGCMTLTISLDFGHYVQGAGGYALDHVSLAYVRRLFDALQVNSLKALEGQTVRASADASRVYAIGHALDDRWFIMAPQPCEEVRPCG